MAQNGETKNVIFVWEKYAVMEEGDEHNRRHEVRHFYKQWMGTQWASRGSYGVHVFTQ